MVYETILGRFGSRMNMLFRPREKRVLMSPLGRFYDIPFEMSLGIRIGNQVRILPFSNEYDSFSFVEQELTPTSVTFYCREPRLGVKAAFRFVAPFYAQNKEVSGAPFFYVEASVENVGVSRLIGDASLSQAESVMRGELFLQLKGIQIPEARQQSDGFHFSVNMSIDPALAKQKWLHKTRGHEFSGSTFAGELGIFLTKPEFGLADPQGVRLPFSIDSGEQASGSFIIVGYTADPVLNVEEKLYRFQYTERLLDIREVLTYARQEKDSIMELCGRTDEILSSGCPDKSAIQLTSFALQSYISNTWWMTAGNLSEWFTVWEGNCAYHSTVDVEYNTSLFYLLLWPELLAMTIRQWIPYVKPGGVMSHDIGKFLVGKGMEYGHDMEVEENCNFILLLFAHYKLTGDLELLENHYDTVCRLIEYVAECDTTGNGFPAKGTANTIDDAGAAVQYAKEQTYLGIKAYAAFTAVRDLANRVNDHTTASMCSRKRDMIRQTLDEQAWLGDHYAVCIQSSAVGVKDVWTDQSIGGEIPGWDAYSIYPSNGLLYLLLTGTAIELDSNRLRTDLEQSSKRSMTRYGCIHSSKDVTGNLWISQNIWKDFTVAYFGVDMLGNLDCYWDYELYENTQGIGGCFVDAPPQAHLNYYPRGVVSIGLSLALGGIQIDKVNRKIAFHPVRVPCRIPLLAFADWSNGVVPWVEFYLVSGHTAARFENGHLLKGYSVTLFGLQLEMPLCHTPH